MKIEFFTKANGRSPVLEDVRHLDPKERARVLGCLECLEQMGQNCHRVELRQIRGKLWEVKIRGFNKDYRIFYVMLNIKTMVLLHFYTKQSQKAPKNEIDIAEKRMMEVLDDK